MILQIKILQKIKISRYCLCDLISDCLEFRHQPNESKTKEEIRRNEECIAKVNSIISAFDDILIAIDEIENLRTKKSLIGRETVFLAENQTFSYN